jgi:hypothetical protein
MGGGEGPGMRGFGEGQQAKFALNPRGLESLQRP